MGQFVYSALFPQQARDRVVFGFCANAKDISEFATIDRVARDDRGRLTGFQRPQVARHIEEIRDYLAKEEAVLPNSIVVAFTHDVEIMQACGAGRITINTDDGPVGVVVDGQQRLCALSTLDRDFEVFVTGICCEDKQELTRQFILINSTRPLPKTLIYELLPQVDGLPDRLSSRSLAALLVERLNYDPESSLRGQIKQHTNPDGIIQDTMVQKLVMNSLSDGALRLLVKASDGIEAARDLLSGFFEAVQAVFADSWVNKKPRDSRLVHGVGIVSMGYVMEYLYSVESARTTEDFIRGVARLAGSVAWTKGSWEFSKEDVRPWNSLQNVPRDYMQLANHLLRILRNTSQPSNR